MMGGSVHQLQLDLMILKCGPISVSWRHEAWHHENLAHESLAHGQAARVGHADLDNLTWITGRRVIPGRVMGPSPETMNATAN
ncbi:hypothetical protein CHELA20_53496 [Hyphomicrobiales bacterium]|nr:hypothetical protein CHELA41_21431 [Hyphomicrobiales bacterium]CAH1684366.1 hypothetical protein CHELA20_53496 [Hyphomicrobiales bacterium]